MKNKKLYPILLAFAALLAATLACSFGRDPALSNTRTALDEDGVNTATTFGAFDTVYVVSDLTNGVSGNVVSSDWYAENF
jgi:hypothetical protein